MQGLAFAVSVLLLVGCASERGGTGSTNGVLTGAGSRIEADFSGTMVTPHATESSPSVRMLPPDTPPVKPSTRK